MGKVLKWVAVALIVVWVVKNPASAGQSVHGWVDAALTFAGSLGGGG